MEERLPAERVVVAEAERRALPEVGEGLVVERQPVLAQAEQGEGRPGVGLERDEAEERHARLVEPLLARLDEAEAPPPLAPRGVELEARLEEAERLVGPAAGPGLLRPARRLLEGDAGLPRGNGRGRTRHGLCERPR